MITVHISSTAPDVILTELGPQLQVLIDLVKNLDKTSLSSGIASPSLRRTQTRLEKCAREVASKASVVVSSRFVSYTLICSQTHKASYFSYQS